ncbi:PREDICTED: group 10 secretory phospholipase A2-like [Bison bison bison]|uniref:Phospholipase A2 n=1 Tax=Bison bison bison TaxID=43346 RepID=A0A6P3HGD7_BISBB|nr:PREDICTED: group 10 secretory phospholipase A2-like [Bison bison bison]
MRIQRNGWDGVTGPPCVAGICALAVKIKGDAKNLEGSAPQRSHVHRRGLIGLAGTIDCVGPRPALVYVKYGCFCGLGGHGQPQDAIDWCCHAHDCCYTHAENSGCNPKVQPYSWNCVSQSVKCEPTEDKCQELICKCDQEFAHCLARAEYNIKYLFYPHFLCGNYSPECD